MPPKTSQGRKSYLQFCPVARALDVVGDRWTLLMLRELLGGPARFNELQAGLPGIAKNLLTARLRQLGILDADAARAVERAIEVVLTEGGPRTRDMGGNAGTVTVGDAIAEAVRDA